MLYLPSASDRTFCLLFVPMLVTFTLASGTTAPRCPLPFRESIHRNSALSAAKKRRESLAGRSAREIRRSRSRQHECIVAHKLLPVDCPAHHPGFVCCSALTLGDRCRSANRKNGRSSRVRSKVSTPSSYSDRFCRPKPSTRQIRTGKKVSSRLIPRAVLYRSPKMQQRALNDRLGVQRVIP